MFALFLFEIMKRRVWIGLVVTPLLLLGVTLWTRKVAWERIEGEFRQEILADATKNPNCSFVVSVANWQHTTDLATLTPAQLKFLLADVHLQKRLPPTSYVDVPASTSLRFAACAGKSNPVSGFYIGATEGGGGIGVIGRSWDLNSKWREFELTLPSCQVLRRLIWAQFGVKLRALHIPPPP